MPRVLGFLRIAAATACILGVSALAAGEPTRPQAAAGTAETLAISGEFSADMVLRNRDNSRVTLSSAIAHRTLVYYMSVTCPHCLNALHEVLELKKNDRLDLEVIVILSGANSDEDVARFLPEAPAGARVFRDVDRTFSSGNAIRSTPVGFLVRPQGDGLQVLGAWRPFRPGSSTLVAMRIAAAEGADPFSAFAEGRHQGRWVCASCHVDEHESWRLTHHAKAWWTLEKGKHIGDESCIGCHVTGLDQLGGYDRTSSSQALTDVTCEACHGPGGPHDGVKSEATASCAGCHDADHTISFELDRALPLIDHFARVGLSEEEARKRRMDLLEGRAPRPLTDFPPGRNVGAAACAECHPEATEHWQASEHAAARDSLAGETSSADPACLVCHSTVGDPGEAGPTFLDEGVGCEMCHGPGEQHVAAKGGRDTILGLGQACPDCVLDAICTRCHTPLRDPDWDLHPALDRVRHRAAPAAAAPQ